MIQAPAKVGCIGCFYYENNQECPIDSLIKDVPIKSWDTKSWPCVEGNYIWVEGNDDGTGEISSP